MEEEKIDSTEGINGNESQKSTGDKQSPGASSGRTSLGYDNLNQKKEASLPGGEENAAGELQNEKDNLNESRKDSGSQPIPNNLIDSGNN